MHSALYLEGRGWLKKIGWGNGVYGNAWAFPISYIYVVYIIYAKTIDYRPTCSLHYFNLYAVRDRINLRDVTDKIPIPTAKTVKKDGSSTNCK